MEGWAKCERLLGSFNAMLIADEASIEETYTLGLNLILGAWRTNPDKEELVDSYIECTVQNLREIMNKILEEEKKQ